jgi:hypothetical protein
MKGRGDEEERNPTRASERSISDREERRSQALKIGLSLTGSYECKNEASMRHFSIRICSGRFDLGTAALSKEINNNSV